MANRQAAPAPPGRVARQDPGGEGERLDAGGLSGELQLIPEGMKNASGGRPQIGSRASVSTSELRRVLVWKNVMDSNLRFYRADVQITMMID